MYVCNGDCNHHFSSLIVCNKTSSFTMNNIRVLTLVAFWKSHCQLVIYIIEKSMSQVYIFPDQNLSLMTLLLLTNFRVVVPSTVGQLGKNLKKFRRFSHIVCLKVYNQNFWKEWHQRKTSKNVDFSPWGNLTLIVYCTIFIFSPCVVVIHELFGKYPKRSQFAFLHDIEEEERLAQKSFTFLRKEF